MSRDNALFIALDEPTRTLEEVAPAVFSALGVPETEVASILANAGFKVFQPIGKWWRLEWDGGGVAYGPAVSS
jgi:hypothetical protein